MDVKSQEGGLGFHEPAKTKWDSDWSLNFHRFSVPWLIIISWCVILLGLLSFWLVRRAWRPDRARKIMQSLGATTYQTSGGEQWNSSCPICINDFEEGEDIRTLPCGHLYRPACLRKQLETGYLRCGLCRGTLV
ncbi:hypothetical protein ACQ4PT_005612 [Festuca glaucescens]